MFAPTFQIQSMDHLGEEVVFHFKPGDIQTTIRKEVYTLISEQAKMYVRLTNGKILNQSEFVFQSETGKAITYKAWQVKQLEGIKELLLTFIAGVERVEKPIHLQENTHVLLDEIMAYHRENLINRYLDARDYKRLRQVLAYVQSRQETCTP